MSSRAHIKYMRVPTEEEEEEDDYFTYDECCSLCCPIRFSALPNLTQRSNKHFYEIQGSHHRDAEREGQAIKRGGLMRWSVASVSGSASGSGYRRGRSDSAPETSANVSASRQPSVNRETNRNGESSRATNTRAAPPAAPRAAPPAAPPAARPAPITGTVPLYERPRRADAALLASLTQDCFIIPTDYVDSFLPAGIPKPFTALYPANLNILEMDDPRQFVVAHVMTNFEPVDPTFENPLATPLQFQRQCATELMAEVSHTRMAYEGFVLSNLERIGQFPIISFYVVNRAQQDPAQFFRAVQHLTYDKYDPMRIRYKTKHTLNMFTEVATIARPPLNPATRRPMGRNTGYIVSVFKVYDGDDGENFERNWLYWTGARMMYYSIPHSSGLRRITLHKSLTRGDKTYLLVCECANFMNNLTAAASVVPPLRARLCGCPGLFRPVASF